MWYASNKFIKEYEKCLKDWFKKNKHEHETYFNTSDIFLCKKNK
uniref:Uncharacterized protein n=1 Tax=Geladintestivirus 5 TaxID=3233137 RepID=A0AAU8MHT2_9CAUD